MFIYLNTYLTLLYFFKKIKAWNEIYHKLHYMWDNAFSYSKSDKYRIQYLTTKNPFSFFF